ncbi:MAG: Rpn family recombination-promoting nuclease/putative transposase, partial [Myxococcota bacterium]
MAFDVHSHDQLVKAAMQHEEVSVPFFRWALPQKIIKLVDPSQIRQARTEFVDPYQKLVADIVFRAPLRAGNGHIVFPLEHESRAKRMMPGRVLQYSARAVMAELTQNAAELPFVWPLVLHTGAAPYNQPTTLSALFPPQTQALSDSVLGASFQLVDLCRLADEELERAGGMAGPLLLVMKHIHGGNIAPLVARLEPRLCHIGHSEQGSRLAGALFAYILHRGQTDRWDAILGIGRACVRPEDREELTMIARTLKGEGLRQGLQEGMQ